MGSPGKARVNLDRAWGFDENNKHVAITRSKCERLDSNYGEAVKWGTKALNISEDVFAARVLLAAGAAAGDEDAMKLASSVLHSHDGSEEKSTAWLVVQGSRILHKSGEDATAIRALENLLENEDYAPAKQLLASIMATPPIRPVAVEGETGARADETPPPGDAVPLTLGTSLTSFVCVDCNQAIGPNQPVRIKTLHGVRARSHRECP